MMKPSHDHPNKKPMNWLVYDINDRLLLKYSPFYKGVLYDLGCGEAPYRHFFMQYVDKYVGVDWSDSFHDTNADIIADLNKPIHIDSEIADTIISWSVLEHLCEPQIMLNESHRILKSGGIFILQVPWQWRVHEAPYDFYRYSPNGLKYMFEKAGFRNVEIEPVSGFFTMWLLKINYFSSRLIPKSKFFRWITKGILMICWYTGQIFAPYLDKLDNDWALETSGYIVIAKKE